MLTKRNRGKLLNKLIIIFIIMVIVMSIITIITAFAASSRETFDTYFDHEVKCSEFAALFVGDGETLEGWLQNGGDEYYVAACEGFMLAKEVFELEDLYIYYPARDESGNLINDMTLVLDTPHGDGDDFRLGTHIGESKAFDTIKEVFEKGVPLVHEGVERTDDKMIIATFSPVIYSDGTVAAVVGVEMDISVVLKALIGHTVFIAVFADIGIVVFAVIIIVMLRLRVVDPLNNISSHMNRFVSSEGTLDFQPISDIHTNDEIEQIAGDFNSMAQNIIDYTKVLAEKTSAEERHRIDYDVASKIRSVVSSEQTYPPFPERSDFDLCTRLGHTKDNRCSFCNYFFTDSGHLFIVLGESFGNDLASMIFTILSLSYIKSFAKMGFDPGKIAAETNNQLCSIEKKDSGLTTGAVIAEIDLKTGMLRYVNAGMPPILIKRPGEEFMADKVIRPFSLGQMRGISFDENTVQLYQGSAVIMTSFGFSDMCDQNGEKYGIDRIVDAANRISLNSDSLDKAVSKFENEAENFRGSAPVLADTAVIAFRYFG